MKLLTLVLLSCAVFAAVADEDYDEQAYATLQKIESTKFGATLIDTIQLQLEAGDPVDDLIGLLRKMEDQVNADQAAADKEIKAKQDECDVDLEKLTGEIAQSKKRIKELKELLAVKIPEREKKQNELKEQERFKALIEDKLATLEKDKAAKEEQWKAEQEEHDRATYAIQKAKEIIKNSMSKQSSFLQKQTISPQAFTELSHHFAEHAKKNQFKRKSWNSLLKILGQITASAPIQANQDSIKRILALCDEILNRIARSREVERQNFQDFIDTYTKIKTGLENMLSDSNRKISELKQVIQSLTRLINQSQNEKQEQEERVKTKQDDHDKLLDLCNNLNVQYSEEREQRGKQREVLSDAIGLLQAKLRLFRKYVNNRLKNIRK